MSLQVATWLGVILSALERHEETLPLFEHNLAIIHPVLGDEYPTVRAGEAALEASRAASPPMTPLQPSDHD